MTPSLVSFSAARERSSVKVEGWKRRRMRTRETGARNLARCRMAGCDSEQDRSRPKLAVSLVGLRRYGWRDRAGRVVWFCVLILGAVGWWIAPRALAFLCIVLVACPALLGALKTCDEL